MKSTISIIFLLIGISFYSGYAQHQASVENRVARLKEFLSLSDEQATKVQEILNKAETRSTQDQQSSSQNKRAMMKNRLERMKTSDKEIEAILNPDQLKKYESYKKERANQIKNNVKGRKFRDE